MYKYKTVIRLRHTDSAGIIFFVSLFDLAHECYESFLDPDFSLTSVIEQGEILMPIVHAVFVGGVEFLGEPGPDLFVEVEARSIVFQNGEKIDILRVFRG